MRPLCLCGCGKPAPLALTTDANRGWVRGEPLRYVAGHYNLPRTPNWLRILKHPDRSGECWLWTARLNRTGYAFIFVRTDDGVWRHRVAHRVSYEAWVGPVPHGLHLDHLCRVRHCVNPGHLEPVTPRENCLRMHAVNRRTHCKRGHLFDAANTYINTAGFRQCRACSRLRMAEKRRLQREATPALCAVLGQPGSAP